ncbi:MAG: hypothetical protein U0Z44_12255 [Kouleothrix sp.]
MRRQLFARIALLISILLIASVPATQRTLAAIRSAAPAVRATPHPAAQPLMFIANAGQLDAPARFQVHGNGATLFLADDAIWLTIIDSMAQNTTRRQFANPASVASPADDSPPGARPAWARGSNIKISFAGANPRPQLEPFGQLDTRVGFFRGAQSNWRAGLVAWSGVRYRDLYPGIDLEVSGANGQLEQQLRVRPGADLGAVQLRVDGAESQRIDGAYLRLSTKAGEVALPLLLAKADNGQPIVTAATPQIHGRTIAAPFAQAAGLAAAPTPQGTNDLLFSSFIGGEYDDKAWAVASDTSGATYITGETFSPGFPKTPGAFDTSCGAAAAANCDYSGQFYAWDAYVVKINAAGTGLSYATFLGGENDDGGYGIAVDADGAAYVTGYTISTAFPIANTLTGTPFDDTCGTDSICNFDGSFYYYDGFLAKLSPDGSALVYSSYFGGANGGGATRSRSIAVTRPTSPGEPLRPISPPHQAPSTRPAAPMGRAISRIIPTTTMALRCDSPATAAIYNTRPTWAATTAKLASTSPSTPTARRMSPATPPPTTSRPHQTRTIPNAAPMACATC